MKTLFLIMAVLTFLFWFGNKAGYVDFTVAIKYTNYNERYVEDGDAVTAVWRRR